MLACLTSGHALAADEIVDLGPMLRLNGYGTLGLSSSHASQPWGFRRDILQPASKRDTSFSPDSNLGLQAHLQVNPRLSLTGQVVLHRRAASSPASENLEWAFVSYQLQPDLVVRVGRTSLDIFLLTDHRNVGFSHPWARPNIEFYGWMPMSSVDGVDVAKTWQHGDVRWVGKARVAISSATVPNLGASDARYRAKSGMTLVLSREQGGLTVKLSLAQARGQIDIKDSQVQQLLAGLRQLEALPVPAVANEAARLGSLVPFQNFTARYASLGMQWDRDPWTVHAEVARVTSGLQPTSGIYGYLGTGYRVGSVTFTGMLGRARSTKAPTADPQWLATLTPVIGLANAQGAQALGSGAAELTNAFRFDQRSASVGLRWDMTPQTALKLQYDRVHVGEDGSGLWSRGTVQSGRADIYSASFNFIF